MSRTYITILNTKNGNNEGGKRKRLKIRDGFVEI